MMMVMMMKYDWTLTHMHLYLTDVIQSLLLGVHVQLIFLWTFAKLWHHTRELNLSKHFKLSLSPPLCDV